MAAASFWNYNASVDASSAQFVQAINQLNNELLARGAYACPTNCSCDQLSACGVPYIKASPPVAGSTLFMQPCEDGNAAQRWAMTSTGGIALASNLSLCMHAAGPDLYPLTLAPCTAADKFLRSSNSSTFVHAATGLCMDMDNVNGVLRTWACGAAQPNQAWAYDAVEEKVLSLMHYPGTNNNFAGECVTAMPTATSS